jgi:hypothetical protein
MSAQGLVLGHTHKMALSQGVSAGNGQLLAFPGRSSSLKSTQFRFRRNTFPVQALRGMNLTNVTFVVVFFAIFGLCPRLLPTAHIHNLIGSSSVAMVCNVFKACGIFISP